MLSVLRAYPSSFRAFVQTGANGARLHPGGRHWFLETMGVAPALQRQGLGGRLLAPVLLIADRDQVDCYLETAEPRNADYYARHGFVVRIQPCSWWRMARPTSRCGAGRRQLLDATKPRPRRKEATNGNGGTTPMTTTPTLYEWAGGEAAIRRLMDCFYDRVERDELLSPYFPGGVSKEHRAHVSTWWSEVLGGPASYTEDLGGYEKMLAHHRGLGIAPEERHRFVSLFSFAADDAAFGTPQVSLGARRLRQGGSALRCTRPKRTPRSSGARLPLAGAGARRPPSSPREVAQAGTTAGGSNRALAGRAKQQADAVERCGATALHHAAAHPRRGDARHQIARPDVDDERRRAKREDSRWNIGARLCLVSA